MAGPSLCSDCHTHATLPGWSSVDGLGLALTLGDFQSTPGDKADTTRNLVTTMAGVDDWSFRVDLVRTSSMPSASDCLG